LSVREKEVSGPLGTEGLTDSVLPYNLYMSASLEKVKAMIVALEFDDQARLLEFLLLRLAKTTMPSIPVEADAVAAWQEFRRVGERLAATSSNQSITRVASDMRRL
jgi:hypothetical protein